MNRIWKIKLMAVIPVLVSNVVQAREWSLSNCIDYALKNNITLQKDRLAAKGIEEDMLQSKADLFPSLNASTSQNVTYRPWPETGSATVANGYVQSSVDKVYYNGTYVVSASWIVWNGNRNYNTVKLQKLAIQQADAKTEATAATIQEKIAQLYVQILYSTEAIRVNAQSLTTSSTNEERGKEMVRVGKMSKADLAQLTAQRVQEEYNLIEARSTLADFKRQLKQLLQLTDDEEFTVAVPTTTDEMALQNIPTTAEVYAAAMEQRPEMKAAQLAIAGSDINVKMARARNLPTISLNGAFGTNTTSMSHTQWGKQLKTNFDIGGGLTLSIPIFDNRAKRTALNKALIERQNYMLDLQDKQAALYSDIEKHWLQATTNQSKFKAAKASVQSAKESFDLLNEQFRLGLKNTIELMTGKDKLVMAQQNELQSKYLAILSINLLNFYKTGEMK
ncbi:outer membrane efflux protein [Hoylesella saccharolytica F0055]|uniref:Outer membrane efflux protein n=1 Tax=Hoylesella saccharolytica F0055 TaxID=1127699 RepID=L1NHW6_9BACT|nr:outer membrane efflux protein [Hoylesella saccharolytica F0055]